MKQKQSSSATIDKELVTWIDGQVKTGKFRNRSHLVEESIKAFKEKEKKA
jgi:Arc/MetJ-type ribon-helix-helix transcriptional regulator